MDNQNVANTLLLHTTIRRTKDIQEQLKYLCAVLQNVATIDLWQLEDSATEHFKPCKKAEARLMELRDLFLESVSEIDIRPAVFQFAVDNNLTVLSLQRDEQKLEEVFQQLTKG